FNYPAPGRPAPIQSYMAYEVPPTGSRQTGIGHCRARQRRQSRVAAPCDGRDSSVVAVVMPMQGGRQIGSATPGSRQAPEVVNNLAGARTDRLVRQPMSDKSESLAAAYRPSPLPQRGNSNARNIGYRST